MKRKILASFVTAALCAFGAIPAAYAAPALPQQVVAIAEAPNLESFGPRLQAMMQQLHPSLMMPPLQLVAATQAARAQDLSSLDFTRPLRLITLQPPLAKFPVLQFSVKDKDAYLNSLLPTLEKMGQKGDVLAFIEHTGPTAPKGSGKPAGQPVFIGAAGLRIVLGPKLEAVQTALSLVKAGELPEKPLFDTDVGVQFGLQKLLSALRAQGADPFEAWRAQLAQQPLPATINAAQMKDIIDMYESFSRQLDSLSAELQLEQTAVTLRFGVGPVQDSILQRYVRSIPDREVKLPQRIPGEAFFGCACLTGDWKPLMNWSLNLMTKLAQSMDQPSPISEEMSGLIREWTGVLGDEIDAGVLGKPGQPLTAIEFMALDDPPKGKRLMRKLAPQVQALLEPYQTPIMKMASEFTPDFASHNGTSIDRWTMKYSFEAPGDSPLMTNIIEMQKASLEALSGNPSEYYTAFPAGGLLFSMGQDGLKYLTQALDGAFTSARDTADIRNQLAGLPQGAVGVAWVRIGPALDWYLGMLRQIMSQAAVAFPIPPIQFKSGPPIAIGVYRGEDGAVQGRVRIPVATLRALVQSVMGPPPAPPQEAPPPGSPSQ